VKARPEVRDRIEQWEALSKQFDLTLPAVALDFASIGVHQVSIGMASKREVKQNLDLLTHNVEFGIYTAAFAQGLLSTEV